MKTLKQIFESIQDINRLTQALKAGNRDEAMKVLAGKRPDDFSMDPSKFRAIANAIQKGDLESAKQLHGIGTMPARGPFAGASTGGKEKVVEVLEEIKKKVFGKYDYYELEYVNRHQNTVSFELLIHDESGASELYSKKVEKIYLGIDTNVFKEDKKSRAVQNSDISDRKGRRGDSRKRTF